MDTDTFLQRFQWLSPLPTAALEGLLKGSSRLRYRPAELIFGPADSPRSVYLLESGLVRIYRLASSGAEATLGLVRPGEVFGELVAFGDYTRDSFAEAIQFTTVWRTPRRLFQRAIARQPSLALEVTRQIIGRFKRLEGRVEDLVFRSVRGRLVHVLLELAEEVGETENRGVRLPPDLHQADLATLIGSSRQTVNQCLHELESEGLLQLNNRYIYLNQPARLASLLSRDQVSAS